MVHGARLAILLSLGLAACVKEEVADPLPTTDRLYFPNGVAIAKPLGGVPYVLVASSNFDLRYSASEGGTLVSVDPATAPDHAAFTAAGSQRIGSYAGPVAVIDGTRCPGAVEEAFVASRYDDVLFRLQLSQGGGLTCGAGCQTHFSSPLRDPFPVAIACRPSGSRAFVGFLSTPTSTQATGAGAWIAELDLSASPSPVRELEIGDGPVRGIAYDAAADRLWLTSRSSGSRALLHTVLLSDPAWAGASPRDAVETYDLYPAVRGAELRSVAVGSTPLSGPQRLYVTARLYDAEYQDSTGNRPSTDVGGVLIVLDVVDGPAGLPLVTVHKVVDLGMGAGDVAVVPNGTNRDVVVVTVADDNLVVVYDDEWEVVASVFGRDPTTGAPALARTPVALAVDPTGAAGTPLVYVAAFGDHDVATFSLDPTRPWAPVKLNRIGGLAP